MTENRTDIKALSEEELKEYMASIGQPPYRARQVFAWIHERLVNDYEAMTDISKALRQKMSEDCIFTVLKKEDVRVSSDGTKKYLFRLEDGSFVETVFMQYRHGYSVCVSTQVGCGMNCAFCASGASGLERNLTASEIIEQVYEISRIERKRIGNIVFMGMGEPLANYDNVIRAIRLLSYDGGYNIGQRQMTLSTCGVVPGIEKLMEEDLGITLAISLHAPTQEKRERIMPIAKSYDLDSLIAATKAYREKTKRRITFEYCLLGEINDSEEDAKSLSKLCKGSDVHVNIIPYHQVENAKFKAPKDVQGFKNRLEKNGINVTIRRELGEDIEGACGQLRLKRKQA